MLPPSLNYQSAQHANSSEIEMLHAGRVSASARESTNEKKWNDNACIAGRSYNAEHCMCDTSAAVADAMRCALRAARSWVSLIDFGGQLWYMQSDASVPRSSVTQTAGGLFQEVRRL
jgi:hypothetical protein